MNVLLVSATEFELASFLPGNKNADVLITGVGIPATIYHLTNKLHAKKYDLVIQAGIAGTFKREIQKGSVVLVKQDAFSDIGIDEKQLFKTLFEIGLAGENDFPYQHGWLINEGENLLNQMLPLVKAVTVNKITDDEGLIKKATEKFSPDIESMEGAAFHYVCLLQKIPFLQLRSISNLVGERDKQKWRMKDAIENLSMELNKLLKNISST